MKITKVSREIVFRVETDETDDEDGYIYHRDEHGNWTYRIGESDEILYDNKRLEFLFQEFVNNEFSSEINDFLKEADGRPPYFKNEVFKQAFIRTFHHVMRNMRQEYFNKLDNSLVVVNDNSEEEQFIGFEVGK